MISPETIDRIKALMEEASVFEEDLEESFILGGGPGGQKTNKTSNVVRLSHEPSGLMVRCGETRSRETNRWLARRMLAELILEREKGRKSAARQAAEKIRRQKRRRSRRQKQKMLDDKHAHSEIKRLRRTIPISPVFSTRGVAQPGSASALGAECRRFKSSRPDHLWQIWDFTNLILRRKRNARSRRVRREEPPAHSRLCQRPTKQNLKLRLLLEAAILNLCVFGKL